MGLLSALTGGLGGKVVEAVSGHYAAKNELKQTKVTAQAKIAMAKADTASKLELSGAELQTLRVAEMGQTWKDEYVVLLVTSPMLAMIIGTLVDPILLAVGSEYSIFAAGERMLKVLTGIEGEYAWVFHGVVVSCLGLREWGKRK